jgi:hypothetical protein
LNEKHPPTHREITIPLEAKPKVSSLMDIQKRALMDRNLAALQGRRWGSGIRGAWLAVVDGLPRGRIPDFDANQICSPSARLRASNNRDEKGVIATAIDRASPFELQKLQPTRSDRKQLTPPET